MDPGFESNALDNYTTVANDFTGKQGVWGAEVGCIFTGTSVDGVTPIGSKMLGVTNAGGGATQTVQVTDISGIFGSGTGNATFDMSARFTMGGNVAGGFKDGRVSVIARFFTGALYNSANTPADLGVSLTLDADPSTWEQLTLSGTIPAGTTWMITEVLYTNASIGTATGYVDDTSFTITYIPEPGSCALAILGAGLLIGRRRRA